MPNNNSGIGAAMTDCGVLGLICNPVSENWGDRTPLCLFLSEDNGATYPVMISRCILLKTAKCFSADGKSSELLTDGILWNSLRVLSTALVSAQLLLSVGSLAFVMLGSTTIASIICCFTMYYVIAQHDGLERYWDYKGIKFIRILLILIGAVALAVQALRGYTLWETWIFYCVGYIIFDLVYFARPKRLKENWEKTKSFKKFLISFGGDATVLPFFYILMIGLLVFGYFNFR